MHTQSFYQSFQEKQCNSQNNGYPSRLHYDDDDDNDDNDNGYLNKRGKMITIINNCKWMDKPCQVILSIIDKRKKNVLLELFKV